MFTKQHYKKIAKILAEHAGIERWIDNDDTMNLLTDLTTDFCDLFKADNENFNREKFQQAVWEE